MTEFRRDRGVRGGKGRGRGNFQGRCNSGATSSFKPYPPQASQPQLQTIRITEPSLETMQSSRTLQGPSLETMQPSHTCQGPSLETIQPSRSIHGISLDTIQSSNTLEAENGGAVSCSNKKRGRGMYKSKSLDMKTKCGLKIKINIPDDIDRAVGDGARDIVNYCGLIMRSTISLKDGNWKEIVLKYGEVMWFKVKDKFEVRVGVREHVLQGFVISTMQRLYRAWKARLSRYYSRHKTANHILSRRPQEVAPEDWKYLIDHFESPKFKAASERNKKNKEKQSTKHSCGTRSFAEVEESTRNPETGEKETPDKVWEIQHTRKNDNGEVVWSDAQS